ncbi:PRC-barrel domain-containing protein [Paenirhodobacter populi]|nr:PRC-barrel domain-containing protein [Sinirhodobacter populi]
MRNNRMITAVFASTMLVGGPGMVLAQTEAPSDAMQQAQQDMGNEPADMAPQGTPDAAPSVAPGATTNPSPLEGYTETAIGTVTVDQLKGVDLYDPEDQKVATISDLEVGTDGSVTRIIMDVGGFLGIGAKPVALTPEQVTLYKNADDQIRGYVSLSKDALQALPDYQAADG